MSSVSYIYFIQAQGDGSIKIGFTQHYPRKRMVKIQSDCPWPVELMGAIKGTLAQEKRIHLVLAPFRTKGEWFAPHPIVLAAVNLSIEIGEPVDAPERRAPRSAHPLCLYRFDNKITMAVMAAKLGISIGHVSEIEKGYNEPSLSLAFKINQETGIEMFSLSGWRRKREVAA